MSLSLMAAIIFSAKAMALNDLDTKREQLRPFLNALAYVESNNNDDAVGDNGKAIGRYQIWNVYWKDAVAKNWVLKGDYVRVKDRIYAERVIVAYLTRFAPDAVATNDYETLARTHNGGPNGPKKKATLRYWSRIKYALRRNKATKS